MSITQDQMEVKITRLCCVCHNPFQPEDESQVLCLGCEELGIRCGCVMPWQSCAVCRAMEALAKGEAALIFDGAWFGYVAEEACL